MQQNLTITYTKAVGIILMVLAHCSSFLLLDNIIGSFHMPLFFIVSGYCFKERYIHESTLFVWRRIKGLWWPYVKYGMLFLAFHNVFFDLNIYNDKYGFMGIVQHLYTADDYLDRAKCILMMTRTECLLGGYWFLTSLFWGSLIAFWMLVGCQLIAKITKLNRILIIAVGGAILLVTCLITNYIPKTFTIFLIGPRDFMSATFFMIGYCFAISKIPKFKWWQSLLAFSTVIVNSCFLHWVISAADIFSDPIKVMPYVITAVLGTWCVYSLPWERLEGKKAKLMEYIGNHTLDILTWHLLCFKLVSLVIIVDYNLPIERLAEFPTIGEYDNRGWFVASTIVGLGVPLLMVYGYEKALIRIKAFFHA